MLASVFSFLVLGMTVKTEWVVLAVAILAIPIAFLSASMAKKKGYNPIVWWWLGYMFTIPTLIALSLLKDRLTSDRTS